MPHAIPATINPAGTKISAAPILVNSINENISKLAKVALVSFDLKPTNFCFELSIINFSFGGKLIETFTDLGTSITLAYYQRSRARLNWIIEEK